MCLSSKNFLICFYEYVHIVCTFARVHMYACVPWHVWRLEHNLMELISLSSTMLVPGIKLESSGLAVSAFAPWTSHCVEGYSRVCRCTWRPRSIVAACLDDSLPYFYVSGVFDACSALREQKRSSDTLELDLEVVVSYNVGTGNSGGIKTTNSFHCWAISPALSLFLR